ncbi:Proteasome subunit beta type-7-B [Camellia lanceoleosa]|uniref:Proteasome subunit beta type-7-B n=1 Tax=Camellia lanceoleosa TaxID=1840588 RepID=A0ACC0G9U2_9ERIC|nr:Proteasome subunit beta type-7-B [Camellia lanceoleosa]
MESINPRFIKECLTVVLANESLVAKKRGQVSLTQLNPIDIIFFEIESMVFLLSPSATTASRCEAQLTHESFTHRPVSSTIHRESVESGSATAGFGGVMVVLRKMTVRERKVWSVSNYCKRYTIAHKTLFFSPKTWLFYSSPFGSRFGRSLSLRFIDLFDNLCILNHRWCGAYSKMSKAAIDVPMKGGFSFDLCRRNEMLIKKGLQSPSFLKTGTTIIGLIFQRDEGVKLVTEAICSGIFNDLGSGSNVDVCVITKGQTEYLRNHQLPNPRTYINERGYLFPKKTG